MFTTNAQKLDQMDMLLEEVLSTLNDTWNPCECCDMRQYESYDEHKLAEKLTGIREKLFNMRGGHLGWLEYEAQEPPHEGERSYKN